MGALNALGLCDSGRISLRRLAGELEEKKEVEFGEGEGIEDFDEDIMSITTEGYLYLSGTPFRAIASGGFIEEQIYNWT